MSDPVPVTLPPLVYRQTPNQSARSTQDVRLVVVHDPEGSYEGSISWILNRSAQVSYHVLTNRDVSHATQFVMWDRKAWSCAQFNSRSDNISIEGHAGNTWTYPALNRLARIVAYRLWKRNLPARFVSAPIDPDHPGRGFTFHSELGHAGGDHHDPGLTGIKKQYFISAVKWHYQFGHFRPSWGR